MATRRRDYDRYELFRNTNGDINQLPFVTIPSNPSDKFERWNQRTSRMDKISQRYYGTPFFDFLILYANPKHLSEFDIPDGTLIRIPFPLERARNDYEQILRRQRDDNGLLDQQ